MADDTVLVEMAVFYDECYSCMGEGQVELAYYDNAEGGYVPLGTVVECPKCEGWGEVERG